MNNSFRGRPTRHGPPPFQPPAGFVNYQGQPQNGQYMNGGLNNPGPLVPVNAVGQPVPPAYQQFGGQQGNWIPAGQPPQFPPPQMLQNQQQFHPAPGYLFGQQALGAGYPPNGGQGPSQPANWMPPNQPLQQPQAPMLPPFPDVELPPGAERVYALIPSFIHENELRFFPMQNQGPVIQEIDEDENQEPDENDEEPFDQHQFNQTVHEDNQHLRQRVQTLEMDMESIRVELAELRNLSQIHIASNSTIHEHVQVFQKVPKNQEMNGPGNENLVSHSSTSPLTEASDIPDKDKKPQNIESHLALNENELQVAGKQENQMVLSDIDALQKDNLTQENGVNGRSGIVLANICKEKEEGVEQKGAMPGGVAAWTLPKNPAPSAQASSHTHSTVLSSTSCTDFPPEKEKNGGVTSQPEDALQKDDVTQENGVNGRSGIGLANICKEKEKGVEQKEKVSGKVAAWTLPMKPAPSAQASSHPQLTVPHTLSSSGPSYSPSEKEGNGEVTSQPKEALLKDNGKKKQMEKALAKNVYQRSGQVISQIPMEEAGQKGAVPGKDADWTLPKKPAPSAQAAPPSNSTVSDTLSSAGASCSTPNKQPGRVTPSGRKTPKGKIKNNKSRTSTPKPRDEDTFDFASLDAQKEEDERKRQEEEARATQEYESFQLKFQEFHEQHTKLYERYINLLGCHRDKIVSGLPRYYQNLLQHLVSLPTFPKGPDVEQFCRERMRNYEGNKNAKSEEMRKFFWHLFQLYCLPEDTYNETLCCHISYLLSLSSKERRLAERDWVEIVDLCNTVETLLEGRLSPPPTVLTRREQRMEDLEKKLRSYLEKRQMESKSKSVDFDIDAFDLVLLGMKQSHRKDPPQWNASSTLQFFTERKNGCKAKNDKMNYQMFICWDVLSKHPSQILDIEAAAMQDIGTWHDEAFLSGIFGDVHNILVQHPFHFI